MKKKVEVIQEEIVAELAEQDALLMSALNDEVTVTFTKLDGTERVMRCTTNMDKIPAEQHPQGENKYAGTRNVRVYDLDISEWRAFNLDRVKGFK
jgi:hypothetical protein